MENEIEAHVTEDLSLVGLWFGGTLPGIHTPKVWVDEEDASKAANLIRELEQRRRDLRETISNDVDEDEIVEANCENCGQSSTFPANLRGSVQDCPHCGKFVDVGPDDSAESFYADQPIRRKPSSTRIRARSDDDPEPPTSQSTDQLTDEPGERPRPTSRPAPLPNVRDLDVRAIADPNAPMTKRQRAGQLLVLVFLFVTISLATALVARHVVLYGLEQLGLRLLSYVLTLALCGWLYSGSDVARWLWILGIGAATIVLLQILFESDVSGAELLWTGSIGLFYAAYAVVLATSPHVGEFLSYQRREMESPWENATDSETH